MWSRAAETSDPGMGGGGGCEGNLFAWEDSNLLLPLATAARGGLGK